MRDRLGQGRHHVIRCTSSSASTLANRGLSSSVQCQRHTVVVVEEDQAGQEQDPPFLRILSPHLALEFLFLARQREARCCYAPAASDPTAAQQSCREEKRRSADLGVAYAYRCANSYHQKCKIVVAGRRSSACFAVPLLLLAKRVPFGRLVLVFVCADEKGGSYARWRSREEETTAKEIDKDEAWSRSGLLCGAEHLTVLALLSPY